MSQQPVINYSLGEATRRKNQDFSLASTPWVTAGQAYTNAVKQVEQPTPPKKDYDIIHFLGDCLEVVFKAQEFMYENFDKYKS